MAHTHGSDEDTVVSVVPALEAVSEYSVAVYGFEGLEFEQPISGSVIDYVLRCMALCLTSLACHSTCHSYCQHMLDTSGRSDWHWDIGLFTMIDTAYVVNQLVDLLEQEGSRSRHSTFLSDGLSSRPDWLASKRSGSCPYIMSQLFLFSFHGRSKPFSIANILPLL